MTPQQKITLAVFGPLMAAGLWAAPASAQQAPVTGQSSTMVTAAMRPEQEFQPLGLQLGDTVLRPSMTVEGEYDSNAYLTPTDPKGDFVIRLKPALTLENQTGNWTFLGGASADIGRYMTTNNDYADYNVQGSAGYAFSDQSNVALTLRHALLHLDRSSFLAPNNVSFPPIQYDLTTVTLTPQYSADPFIGSAKLEYRDYDFHPQGPISNGDMSNQQGYVSNRFGYQVDNLWTVFVEPSYEVHQYDQKFDRNGNALSSQIVGGLVGFNYSMPNDMFLELGVGYFYQDFFTLTPGESNVGGVAASGSLTWNIDPVLTLYGTVGRSVSDVIATAGDPFTTNATSQVTTSGSLRLDWLIRDDTLLFVGSGIAHDEFPSSILTADTISATTGVRYYFNPNLIAGLQYLYTDRESNDPAYRFTDNRITLSVTGRM